MTLVKVCGLTRQEDVECVNGLRPDMVGFVFYPPSRRHVTADRARELGSGLDPSITPVGVFVDEDPLVVADIVDRGIVSAVQLHGFEDDEYIRGLRRLVDVPIIKAFCVRSMEDIAHARDSQADIVMLDAGKGSGRTFDWSLIGSMDRDFILSGGLSPGNVSEAIGRLHPYGVDVSSGIETDGRKDPAKVRDFIASARSVS